MSWSPGCRPSCRPRCWWCCTCRRAGRALWPRSSTGPVRCRRRRPPAPPRCGLARSRWPPPGDRRAVPVRRQGPRTPGDRCAPVRRPRRRCCGPGGHRVPGWGGGRAGPGGRPVPRHAQRGVAAAQRRPCAAGGEDGPPAGRARCRAGRSGRRRPALGTGVEGGRHRTSGRSGRRQRAGRPRAAVRDDLPGLQCPASRHRPATLSGRARMDGGGAAQRAG